MENRLAREEVVMWINSFSLSSPSSYDSENAHTLDELSKDEMGLVIQLHDISNRNDEYRKRSEYIRECSNMISMEEGYTWKNNRV